MVNKPDVTQAIGIVRQRLEALAKFGKATPSEPAIEDRLRRWHTATEAAFEGVLSRAEVQRFADLVFVLDPDEWAQEPAGARFYRAAGEYLGGLLKDLDEGPEGVLLAAPAPTGSVGTQAHRPATVSAQMIRLFIAHSSEDVVLAAHVVRLLGLALNLTQADIRCTSVDGYKLEAGADIDEQLRREAFGAEAFLGIVSRASIASTYVIFELGARWGANKKLIPLLAPGMTPSSLPGPLGGKHALHVVNAAEVYQLVSDLGKQLGIRPQDPPAYDAEVRAIAALPAPPTAAVSSTPPPNAGPQELLELLTLLISLRDRGVHDILNRKTSGVLDDRWLLEHELWKDEVVAALQRWGLAHRFDPLVFVEDHERFRTIEDPALRKQLNMLAMRLDRLGKLIEETERAIPYPVLIAAKQ